MNQSPQDSKTKKLNIYKGIQNIKNLVALFDNKSKYIGVNMLLTTGDEMTFLAYVTDNRFIFRGKVYLIDPKALKYNRNFKFHFARYHEGITLPFTFSITPNDVKRLLTPLPSEHEYYTYTESIDPVTLKTFIDAQNARQAMFEGKNNSGFALLLSVITIIISALTLFFVIGSSGIV